MFSDNDNLKNTVGQLSYDEMNMDELLIELDKVIKCIRGIHGEFEPYWTDVTNTLNGINEE